ncbi:MAG: hypothetical protein ACXWJ2_00865 [Hyphomicrobium sp.]|jgi:hypothetical protein
MAEQVKYKIEFYHLGQGTEFSHVFDSKLDYELAKRFLDQLLGPRDVAPEHQKLQGGATVDFYGVNDSEYRAFRDFMRRQG